MGPSADGEYVDMAYCHDDMHDVLIVENCRMERKDTEPPKVAPKYFNITILDSNGAPITMNSSPTEVTEHDTNQDNKETLILANLSATTTTTRHEEEGGDEESLSSAETKTTSQSNSGTHATSNAGGDGGLLGSIIRHIREKTTTVDSEEIPEAESGHFVAIQMRELECYRATSSGNDPVKSSTLTSVSSGRHKNHTHLTRQSIVQRGSKFTPSVESIPEACDVMQSQQSLYEECPTTPRVTISFQTGERVTPVDKLFALSSDHFERPGCSQLQTDCSELSSGNRSGKDIRERERGEMKRSSMPGTSRVMERSGWRGGMRDRFFSYSAGDYVKMHPANPLGH